MTAQRRNPRAVTMPTPGMLLISAFGNLSLRRQEQSRGWSKRASHGKYVERRQPREYAERFLGRGADGSGKAV
jgi:hypothetical protein